MASGAYNKGVTDLLDGTNPFLTTTLKMLLVSTATAYTFNPDDDVADAGGANDVVDAETNVSGYTRGWGGAGRKTLASKTVTEDDANNRVILDAADVTWTALATGQTLAAAIIVKEGGANDTTTRLFFYLDFTDTPTNGGDITVTVANIAYFNT